MQTKGSKHQSEKENETDIQLIETHNQTFTCTKEKTSKASPTSLLKIMLFLCFYNSLTTPTQIVFQTLLTVSEAQLNLN